MPARGYEFYLRVFGCSSLTPYSVYYINRHFPEVFRTFPEDFRKISEDCPKSIRAFLIIFRKFPKMSEDFRRLQNISEQSSTTFRSYRNKFRFVQQLNLVNLVAHMTSLISSHAKISCFQSKRNPCNSLKFI